jgi:hypothetical protein
VFIVKSTAFPHHTTRGGLYHNCLDWLRLSAAHGLFWGLELAKQAKDGSIRACKRTTSLTDTMKSTLSLSEDDLDELLQASNGKIR